MLSEVPNPEYSMKKKLSNKKGEIMKQKRIVYKNKPIYLLFADADYGGDEINELETVTNPFSGQSIDMPKFAVAVYDVTMGSNHIAERYDQNMERDPLRRGRMSVRALTGSENILLSNTWYC